MISMIDATAASGALDDDGTGAVPVSTPIASTGPGNWVSSTAKAITQASTANRATVGSARVAIGANGC